MFDPRRGERHEPPPPLDLDDMNGYVETSPTGQYGRYDVELGKGAMKTVYRAFDELNGTEVAWNQAKLCVVMQSPENQERMYSEVQLLSTLSHRSIIRFQASWIDLKARTFNFITEMFTSGTLREYRRKYPRVDIRAVKSWARQILEGLMYLHKHDPPVIHRDLKCDNIFVNGHLGEVKIGDLGLAAVLRGSQSAHSVIGTPEFMAPELYEEEYNELVDIYSFGMCMLEMLTTELPYIECANPAQIYKKVTAGKLPDAFYRLRDPEARRFVGLCLENASKRPSAKELLSDPFFLGHETRHSAPARPLGPPAVKTDCSAERRSRHGCRDMLAGRNPPADMTITGIVNPDDDALYLTVQIADQNGHVRNIYFPFDIISDTPIGVANEMVKELEITDREPEDIASMIQREILYLVPNWKENGGRPAAGHHRHEYDFEEDAEEYGLSSPASSQSSLFDSGKPCVISPDLGEPSQVAEWLQEDDASSVHSEKYSAVSYSSGNEHDSELSTNRAKLSAESSIKSKRHVSKEISAIGAQLTSNLQRQCSLLQPLPETGDPPANRGRKRSTDGRRLLRNRSMVDIRSQLLHRKLVEGLKKRLFKTVGAVENIGFQMPFDGSSSSSSSSPSKSHGDRKKPEKKLEK